MSDAKTHTVEPKKWQLQRDKERISELEYVPHLNSTMSGTYVPKELNYRGKREWNPITPRDQKELP